MPITPISYVPIPAAIPRRVVDTRTLGALLRQQGEDALNLNLARANNAALLWRQLGQVFSTYAQGTRADAANAAALAEKKRLADADDQIKRDELAQRKAERDEAARVKKEADERQRRLDAEKRGDAVAESVGYGPVSEATLGELLQSPAQAARTRYSFGPGTAEGPELLPTKDQQALIDFKKDIETQGGKVSPTGAVMMPPAAPKLTFGAPTPAMVGGKRVFVRSGSDGKTYDMKGQPIIDDPTPIDPQSGNGAPRPLTQTAEAQIIQRLSNQWNTAVKPIKDLNRQVELMKTGMEAVKRGDLAQGAQTVLVTFQKILDPPSVVRESEYMRSAAGQSMLNRVKGAYQQLTRGGAGVTPDQLQKFATLANEAAQAQLRAAGLPQIKSRLAKTAQRYSIPEELVFDESFEPSDAPPPTVEEWGRDANGNLVKKGGD